MQPLTLASSSVEAAAGDDSLSVSVLSGSTITAGSGADTINLVKAISSEVYSNQGNDLVFASVMPPQPLLLVVRELIPSALVVTLLAARSSVIPVQTASPLLALLIGTGTVELTTTP